MSTKYRLTKGPEVDAPHVGDYDEKAVAEKYVLLNRELFEGTTPVITTVEFNDDFEAPEYIEGNQEEVKLDE